MPTPPRTRSRNALRQTLRDEAGFSLAELMVVLVIIGILALLALPRFMKVTTRAKMTEAKLQLSQLHTLQQTHYYEYDRYADRLQALDYEAALPITEGGTARYRLRIEQAGTGEYQATATALVDFDQDGTFNVWEVDQTGRVRQRTAD